MGHYTLPNQSSGCCLQVWHHAFIGLQCHLLCWTLGGRATNGPPHVLYMDTSHSCLRALGECFSFLYCSVVKSKYIELNWCKLLPNPSVHWSRAHISASTTKHADGMLNYSNQANLKFDTHTHKCPRPARWLEFAAGIWKFLHWFCTSLLRRWWV